MQHDAKQLHQIAQDYPWHTFTLEEIALLCNVSRDVVTRVRSANDSPFFLNKCRPEWFLEWMRQHPAFQLTKAPVVITKPEMDPNELGSSGSRVLRMTRSKNPHASPNQASKKSR